MTAVPRVRGLDGLHESLYPHHESIYTKRSARRRSFTTNDRKYSTRRPIGAPNNPRRPSFAAAERPAAAHAGSFALSGGARAESERRATPRDGSFDALY